MHAVIRDEYRSGKDTFFNNSKLVSYRLNTEYIGLILSSFHLQENATFPVKLPLGSQVKLCSVTGVYKQQAHTIQDKTSIIHTLF